MLQTQREDKLKMITYNSKQDHQVSSINYPWRDMHGPFCPAPQHGKPANPKIWTNGGVS
jgi:hypothetical protein